MTGQENFHLLIAILLSLCIFFFFLNNQHRINKISYLCGFWLGIAGFWVGRRQDHTLAKFWNKEKNTITH